MLSLDVNVLLEHGEELISSLCSIFSVGGNGGLGGFGGEDFTVNEKKEDNVSVLTQTGVP